MSLMLGKCLETAMRQTFKVAIPRLKFDDYLNMYFRENDQILVHDPNEECKPGDWILVKELPQRLSLKVNHKMEKIVYSAGNIIDPISGRVSLGHHFDDEVNRQSQIFGSKPLTQRKL